MKSEIKILLGDEKNIYKEKIVRLGFSDDKNLGTFMSYIYK